jgi:hypothetical protein
LFLKRKTLQILLYYPFPAFLFSNMAAVCFYDGSINALVLEYALFIPTAVTLILTAVSISPWGKQWLFFSFGMYLHAWQWIIWTMQSAFRIVRPHPYCTQYRMAVFPSPMAFYVAAMITLAVSYSIFWKVPMSPFSWIIMYTLVFIPPSLLVWFGINIWWEVAYSMILGMVASLLFVSVAWMYITPLLKYMLNQAPWSWLCPVDNYCLLEEEQRDEVLKVKEIVEKCEKLMAADALGQERHGCPWQRWVYGSL